MLQQATAAASLTDSCRFCQPEPHRTIGSTGNFKVRLGVGPLVAGYLLILPRLHYGCMGALPVELQEEFLLVKSMVRETLEETYGACMFFEHGRVGTCDVQPGEQLCYHAHIHALPLGIDLLPRLEDTFPPIALGSYDELFDWYGRLGHYLFYETPVGEPFVFGVNRPIPRQYLRHVAAEAIGHPEFANWQDYPRWDVVEEGRKKLLGKFSLEEVDAGWS